MSRHGGTDPSGLNDDELAEAFTAGEHGSLGEVYARHADAVYRRGVERLGDRPAAEDLTEYVFVSAWRNRFSFDRTGTTLARWLTDIAEARIGELRRDSSGRRPDDDMVRSHTVLMLAVYERRTPEEIADRLGMSLDTVEGHLRRGLLDLRDRLRDSR